MDDTSKTGKNPDLVVDALKSYGHEELKDFFKNPIWLYMRRFLVDRLKLVEAAILSGDIELLWRADPDNVLFRSEDALRGARVELMFFLDHLEIATIEDIAIMKAEEEENKQEEEENDEELVTTLPPVD